MKENFLIREIKNTFSPTGKMVSRLIVINIVLFLVLRVTDLIAFLSASDFTIQSLISYPYFILALPSGLSNLLTHPWTLITYGFTHFELFHLVFNMLWLFWIGSILTEYLGNKKILPVYMMGSWFGGALYILFYNIFPYFSNVVDQSSCIGASAGIMAIILAAAVLLPDYSIIIFIWPIRLKWLAAIFVGIDIISISFDGNPGGHIAHLGGALFGYIYIASYRNGTDLSLWFNNVADSIISVLSGRKKMKVTYSSTSSRSYERKKDIDKQKKIDSILDKISKSGYESLSAEEKEILFKESRN